MDFVISIVYIDFLGHLTPLENDIVPRLENKKIRIEF